MRVFVTGASGFIGSAIVPEVLHAGHQVLGLARSDAAAASLVAAGAQVHRGSIKDLESVRRGAAAADGVIHTAFVHDFARFKEVCEIDRRAITALGDALAGSGRPLVVTSGTLVVAQGRLATEDDAPAVASDQLPRAATEEAPRAAADRGAHVAVVRLSPSVHRDGDHGFVRTFITIAREKGVSAYVGDGRNRWTAVHRLDAAHLFRLALEKNAPDARYHGSDESGIPFRDIAEAIGRHLNVPVVAQSPDEAAGHFGALAAFAALDAPTCNERTRAQLGWQPALPGLITDLNESAQYFAP